MHMSYVLINLITAVYGIAFAFCAIQFARLSTQGYNEGACLIYSIFFTFLVFMVGYLVGMPHAKPL